MGALFDATKDILKLPGELLGLGGQKMPDPPAPPAPPEAPSRTPGMDDKAPGQAASRERRRQGAAQGRRSTMLTSPLGLTEPASTSRRQLLGR